MLKNSALNFLGVCNRKSVHHAPATPVLAGSTRLLEIYRLITAIVAMIVHVISVTKQRTRFRNFDTGTRRTINNSNLTVSHPSVLQTSDI